MPSTTHTLDNIVVVNLDIHIWTARKKLTPPDLGSGVNVPPELPPGELASLGSKKICDPESLRIFGALKARAVNLLDRHGVRFLSGWAIPQGKVTKLSVELASIRNEFITAKENFLQSYDQAVKDWISKHPQWAGIIAGSTVSEDYVRSRIDFNWQMFQVKVPDAVTTAQDSFGAQIDSLGQTLFAEIAKSAQETWQRCYAGKNSVTRKALSPLKSIQEKLAGLSFIEPRVAPVAELLENAFKTIPARGALKGTILTMLQGLLMILQNPKLLCEQGQQILDGQNTAQILGKLAIGESTLLNKSISVNADVTTRDSPATGSPLTIASHGLW